ncbi:MAG TPA: hypothetical protein VFV54_08180 [Thermoanaerobaculia bacterium]|nr:hypothetical protein [Thermoanaerobaculia bacterium]
MSAHSFVQNFPIFEVNAQSLQYIRRQQRQRWSCVVSRWISHTTQVVPSVNAPPWNHSPIGAC